MYLVIENNNITQLCEDINTLFDFLKVEVTDEGLVKIGENNIDTISYNMQEYSKEEVIRDLKRNRLKYFECILKIAIFKVERI